MCCHINTGFGDDFLNPKTIFERKNMSNKVILPVTLTPIITIPAGETLHVRLLPWWDTATSKDGKYFCVKNVRIEGQAFEPSSTGVESVSATSGGAQKIFHDGQMFILRNGVEYTINGQIVK